MSTCDLSARWISITAARRHGFDGEVLIVTAGLSDQEAIQLVQAGVAGILHKHYSTKVLCESIREIANGEVCLENAYLGPLFRSVDRTRTPATLPKLTERDKSRASPAEASALQHLADSRPGGRDSWNADGSGRSSLAYP